MKAQIGVGILGGTGYGAGELLRVLSTHPTAELLSVVSSSQAGTPLEAQHPALAGFYEGLTFDKELDLTRFEPFDHNVVFAALPHGTSAEAIAKLVENPLFEKYHVRLIDLSGDFRLQNPVARNEHYPEATASAGLRSQFVYGLSEVAREKIRKARFVANPGCLSSCCALAVLPLVDSTFRGRIVFDAKTGTSGGGRALAETMHHPLRHASVNAYKMLQHRHEPEIREALGDYEHQRLSTVFVPHLLPVSRGIFASAYIQFSIERSTAELLTLYRDFYRDAPFVRIREGSPELGAVVGSNFCDISVVARGREVVAFAALDNLVKGMAGQAIQNMNLMCDRAETEGLWNPPLPLL